MAQAIGAKKKHTPGSSTDKEEIFDFPFIKDEETVSFVTDHGRIMFIVRGPPGTGKNNLTSMVKERYPTSVLCCADNYFTNSFSIQRSRETLAESHKYCHKKSKEACMNNNHPIIVQNTHMRKREMQEYIDYAAEHHYTIIMAVTLRKFDATPQLLEQSNKKGLTARYFNNRLKQWEESPAVVTGWFICPDDASYVLKQVQDSIEVLLGDGKFCRIFNVFDRDELMNYYRARKLLYSIAACCVDVGYMDYKMKQYYLSDKVQDVYGKCFSINIQCYLVTPRMIIGIVPVTKEMEQLMLVRKDIAPQIKDQSEMDELVTSFDAMNIDSNIVNHSKMISLNEEFLGVGKTALLCSLEDKEIINIKNSAFIHIAHRGDHAILKANEVAGISHLLSQAANSEGFIDEDQFMEIKDDVKVFRFGEDAWIVKPPKKICLKTVFTGLYI